MARFVFFFLLLVNAGLAAWVYLHRESPKAPPPPEVNAAAFKIVSVTDPAKAQTDALAARKLAQSLSGAACVDFGVKPADGNRAQVLFASMLERFFALTASVNSFTQLVAKFRQRDGVLKGGDTGPVVNREGRDVRQPHVDIRMILRGLGPEPVEQGHGHSITRVRGCRSAGKDRPRR